MKYKVLADGVEAMLGAYLLAGGLEGAWAALAAFNILPVPEDVVYPAVPDAEKNPIGAGGLLTEEVTPRLESLQHLTCLLLCKL